VVGDRPDRQRVQQRSDAHRAAEQKAAEHDGRLHGGANDPHRVPAPGNPGAEAVAGAGAEPGADVEAGGDAVSGHATEE
jgi:hypothetical protein